MNNTQVETATQTTDTPQVLLEHHLKELRLPTILREYDRVARQCAVEQVGYPRYCYASLNWSYSIENAAPPIAAYVRLEHFR
jgi:hypothetical protein